MKSKSNNDSPTLITHEGNFIADPLSITNIFNDFFLNNCSESAIQKKVFQQIFFRFLTSPYQCIMLISQIPEDEIFKIISSLNSSKSTGPYSIPTKILKPLKVPIPKHPTDIFNISFTTGIFPNSLKSAKVIPIHKKKLKTGCL